MNNNINNHDGYVEIRNDSHARLIFRIVKTESGNTHIYIEDAPQNLTFKEQEELTKDGWEIADSSEGTLIQVQMSQY